MADVQINLTGTIDNVTVPRLIDQVSQRVGAGARSILLAISSPGGNIYWGVTAYNFLKGLGITLTTHGVGQIDSIAGAIYCAGERRLCVKHGRFLIHGVNMTFGGQNPTQSEKELRDSLAGLERDRDTIASILADGTGRTVDAVKDDMFQGLIMNAEEAKTYGFVHEITDNVFDPSQEIVNIMSA